jgi:hypothetical protein
MTTRFLPSVAAAWLVALMISACGDPSDPTWTPGEFAAPSTYAAYCAAPRSGTNPATGSAYPDVQGSAVWENFWLRSWTNAYYLWYSEVPDINPAGYATADYFNLMKTTQTTASGRPTDRFHFTYPTPQWYAMSQTGLQVSYGIGWSLISAAPPRQVLVAYVQDNAPSAIAALSIPRGATVINIDGVDMVNGSDIATLDAGLYPSNPNESHTFVIQDTPSSSPRTVTLVSAVVTSAPVQATKTVTGLDGAKVGYILFNSLEANAETNMLTAMNTLVSQGATDLVLDLRYNAGGFLTVAAEVAYMIAGPGPTTGKIFEAEDFNDKYPNTNPITGGPLTVVGFQSTTIGIPGGLPAGQALPHLDLARVFVLTTSSTCSASESIINGLRGVGINVIQMGARTCGKPYGFYPTDNCGTTYFSIQIQGVNNAGFGDFPDGFAPENSPLLPSVYLPGCTVADDYTHALGDPNEALLAAALQYRAAPGTCPAVSKNISIRNTLYRPIEPSQEIVKPEVLMNKFLR